MPNTISHFLWYELMTTDTDEAQTFYQAVVGWGARDMEHPSPDLKYTLFTVGETGVAGLMKLPAEASASGVQPGWVGYIGVDDTDAYAQRIEGAGGKVLRAPQDIPGVGRFAVVADPHGAMFHLMTPIGEAPADYPAPDAVGMVGWRELHAGDGPEAFAFYSELFGWKKAYGMDMGQMGVYQLFNDGENDYGAMMTKMPDIPAPFWLYYFNVPSIGEAIQRVEEHKGRVLMGPHEVPGGSWIVQCLDPQGAVFALVSPRR